MRYFLLFMLSLSITFKAFGETVLYCNDEIMKFLYGDKTRIIEVRTPDRHTIKFNKNATKLELLTSAEYLKGVDEKLYMKYFNCKSRDSEGIEFFCLDEQDYSSFKFNYRTGQYLYHDVGGYGSHVIPSIPDSLHVGTCVEF